MNSKLQATKTGGSAGDLAKYTVSILLVVAGLAAFYWFDGQWPASLRVLAVVAGLVAATVVFLTTRKGGHTREFLSESRFELRKVVWPARQDSIRMTGVIIVVIVVFSLFLSLVDLLIGTGINKLLG